MSIENVKAFYAKMANDEAFRARIQSAKSKDECSKMVKAAGFEFTLEEFEEYTSGLLELNEIDRNSEEEINQKKLEVITGGFFNPDNLFAMYQVRSDWARKAVNSIINLPKM
ncbi:MAG: Nif11-like leader peptide family natural product precursor [Xenococcaceae cyanobacterium]